MLIGAFYRLPRCVGCGCLRAGEEEVFVCSRRSCNSKRFYRWSAVGKDRGNLTAKETDMRKR